MSVTTRLPEGYRDWLDRQAELTGLGVTRSDIIRQVVGSAMKGSTTAAGLGGGVVVEPYHAPGVAGVTTTARRGGR